MSDAEDIPTIETEPVTVDAEVELKRLAAMGPLEYEQQRKAAAEALGCRAPMLDRLVAAEQRAAGLVDDGLQGHDFKLENPEPWPDPVAGPDLVAALVLNIRRHVILSEHEAIAVALWVLHAHALDCSEHSPRLHFSSPEKGCGKSTLLRTVLPLVPRPVSTGGISVAAMFRIIAAHRPTLLIDEVDAFLNTSEDHRALLNEGHHCKGQVIRTVGDQHEVRGFKVWAATVIAGIGRVPETVLDRSITIHMRKRTSSEPIERLRSNHTEHLTELARKAARWTADNRIRLQVADPDLPDVLADRTHDNWRPLVAIADAIGAEWGRKARDAAVHLNGKVYEDAEPSIGNQLIADIWSIFEDKGKDRLRSAEVVNALNEMEDRPWAEWKHGKPCTSNSIARILKQYAIAPKQLRIGNDNAKGYSREMFEDAVTRYVHNRNPVMSPIPPSATETGKQVSVINGLGGNQTETSPPHVSVVNRPNSLENNDCFPVSVGTPPKAWEGRL